MKVTAQIAFIFLAVGVYSRTVSPRALQDFQDVLAGVQGDVDALDTTVKAFNGNGAPVQAAAATLVSTIQSGNSYLSGQPQLTLGETLTLNSNVDSFKTHAQTLVNDLKAKRPAVAAASLCAVTRQQIATINTNSQTLMNTIVSKVPAIAQSIAQAQVTALTNILNDAQNAYSTTNCVNAH